MKIKLKRKDYTGLGASIFEIQFVESPRNGFCGSVFVEQFPAMAEAKQMTMTVSRTRTRRSGEKRFVFDTSHRVPGVTHKGEFIQLVKSTAAHFRRKLKLHGGEGVYVSVKFVS